MYTIIRSKSTKHTNDDDGKVYLTQPMDLICIELGISFDNLFLYVKQQKKKYLNVCLNLGAFFFVVYLYVCM